jgi:hypothetical protein
MSKPSVFCYALSLGALCACSASGTATPPGPAAAGGSAATQSAISRADSTRYGQMLRAALYPGRTGMHPALKSGGWLSAEAKRRAPLIYSANFDTDTITIYPAKGKNRPPIGQITNGLSEPERLFVDKSGNVYATNPGNETITAYARGTTSPSRTLSTGLDGPTGLTVDSEGTVYAANTGNDTVVEYAAGSSSPTLTITLSVTPENMAIDSKDNLYVQYLGGSAGSGVLKFAPGSTSGTDLGLSVVSAAAVEVDRKGNVIVLDQGSDMIDYFAPGQTSPSKTVPVTAGLPFELSLNGKETELYVSVDLGEDFLIQNVAYPKGTALANKIDNSANGWPLAASPDAVL